MLRSRSSGSQGCQAEAELGEAIHTRPRPDQVLVDREALAGAAFFEEAQGEVAAAGEVERDAPTVVPEELHELGCVGIDVLEKMPEDVPVPGDPQPRTWA